MKWVSVFQQHACRDRQDAIAGMEQLEAELGRLVQAGQGAWPGVQVSPQDFVAFLARHLPAEAVQPAALQALCAHELYLVCAYGLDSPEAAQILESQYMSKVGKQLLRIGTAPPLVEDILQDLRIRLADMQRPEVTRRGYSGRSALLAWLNLSAMRESRHLQKRGLREQALEEAATDLLSSAAKDPELMQLIELYKRSFFQAFRDAIATLTSRQRNLLRYHYLDRLSIDAIGLLYHVHRTTAARWVARAQEQLAERSRELFLARIPMENDSLTRVLKLLESQIHLNLGQVLPDGAEAEIESGQATP